MSSQGQFQAQLLCREYLNRHTSNTTLSLMAQQTSSSLFATMMRPAAECQIPEIQAFTAKILGLTEVINGLGGKEWSAQR